MASQFPSVPAAAKPRANGEAKRRGPRDAVSISAPISPRYIWTARLRSSPISIAAPASSSDSQPRAPGRANRGVWRSGDDVLSAAEHLLRSLSIPLRKCRSAAGPRCRAPTASASLFPVSLVQRHKRSLCLCKPAIYPSTHPFAANLVDQDRSGIAQVDHIHVVGDRALLDVSARSDKNPEGNSSRGSIAMSMSLCCKASPRAHDPNNHTSASCSPSAVSTIRRNSSIARPRVGFTTIASRNTRPQDTLSRPNLQFPQGGRNPALDLRRCRRAKAYPIDRQTLYKSQDRMGRSRYGITSPPRWCVL